MSTPRGRLVRTRRCRRGFAHGSAVSPRRQAAPARDRRAPVAVLPRACRDARPRRHRSTSLIADFDADAAIAERLRALERYWDPRGGAPRTHRTSRGARSAEIATTTTTRGSGSRWSSSSACAGPATLAGPRSCFASRRVAGTGGRRAEPRRGFLGRAGPWDRAPGTMTATPSPTRRTPSSGCTSPNCETPAEAPESIVAEEMYEWVLAASTRAARATPRHRAILGQAARRRDA